MPGRQLNRLCLIHPDPNGTRSKCTVEFTIANAANATFPRPAADKPIARNSLRPDTFSFNLSFIVEAIAGSNGCFLGMPEVS